MATRTEDLAAAFDQTAAAVGVERRRDFMGRLLPQERIRFEICVQDKYGYAVGFELNNLAEVEALKAHIDAEAIKAGLK